MKIIVTHSSPDLDAITSVWLLKKYLPGWNEAKVEFVPAGERFERLVNKRLASSSGVELSAIEKIGNDEVIHVDTGMGPLDHHQTSDENVCAASRTFDYVKKSMSSDHKEAIERMVKVVVDIDHFKEVFWDNPTADYHDFSLLGILDGLKLQKVDDDLFYTDFVIQCLDALLHEFQNKIWAEKEISDAEHENKFKTKWGNGIGFNTINDSVVKLAQKMGYVLVIRKDPRKGYVRIKATPKADIDLTLLSEQLRKMDPQATWFLHVSKKMLLNGSVKNPKMKPTTLSLNDIIEAAKKV